MPKNINKTLLGAGHQQNAHTTSSSSPPLTAQPSPLSPEEQHRELDDLLTDMLLTVENIPDVRPSRALSTRTSSGDTLDTVIRTLDNVSFIDDDEIPYHARQDSRPFTYGSVVENTGKFSVITALVE